MWAVNAIDSGTCLESIHFQQFERVTLNEELNDTPFTIQIIVLLVDLLNAFALLVIITFQRQFFFRNPQRRNPSRGHVGVIILFSFSRVLVILVFKFLN